MLSTLSESGRKVLRGRPGWIRKVNADGRRMGARVVSQDAVAGTTMAAIPLDEFIGRLEGGAPRRQGKKKRA
jgi:energy-converting hydrogenase Eha subunit B